MYKYTKFGRKYKSFFTFVSDSTQGKMITRLDAEQLLQKAVKKPVLDVRSPAEYLQGHIPGAINIPLFNDEERAAIGTLYKNSGRGTAVLKGLEMVGPKMEGIVREVDSMHLGEELLVHCWRGGMRSENMAWLLSLAGYNVFLLNGGYKSYRKFIRTALSRPAMVFVLGGLTGSGKTEILHALGQFDQQVLDLEKIAHHKGSAFGALGEQPQPTNEQFENDIGFKWVEFDLNKPIWIEDESRGIGTVSIPGPLFEQISSGTMFRIECPAEIRINRLVREYSKYPKEELAGALDRIKEKLADRLKIAVTALEEGNYSEVVRLTLKYYDKSYEFSVNRRPGMTVFPVHISMDDPVSTAKKLIGLSMETPITKSIHHASDIPRQ